MQTIGLAIDQLHYAGLRNSQIRRAVQRLIRADEPEHPDTTREVIGDLFGPDGRKDRQWARLYRPLAVQA